METIEIGKDQEALRSLIIKGSLFTFFWFVLMVVVAINTKVGDASFILFLFLTVIYGAIIVNTFSEKTIKIILSEEGVQLTNHDFYKWSDIKSCKVFKKEEVDGMITLLHLEFHNNEEIDFNLQLFERSDKEIENLFCEYLENYNESDGKRKPAL